VRYRFFPRNTATKTTTKRYPRRLTERTTCTRLFNLSRRTGSLRSDDVPSSKKASDDSNQIVHDVDNPGASTSTVEGGPTERLCCPVNGPFPSWVSGSAYTIVPASTGTLFGSKRLLGDFKASTPSDDVLLWYFATQVRSYLRRRLEVQSQLSGTAQLCGVLTFLQSYSSPVNRRWWGLRPGNQSPLALRYDLPYLVAK
jgi:hypothetical protein